MRPARNFMLCPLAVAYEIQCPVPRRRTGGGGGSWRGVSIMGHSARNLAAAGAGNLFGTERNEQSRHAILKEKTKKKSQRDNISLTCVHVEPVSQGERDFRPK